MRIKRAAAGVKEISQPIQPRLGVGLFDQIPAGFGAGFVGQQPVHTIGTEINIPFIGMKAETLIPIDAVQPQRQGHGHNSRQHKKRPGNPAVKGKDLRGGGPARRFRRAIRRCRAIPV